MVTVGALLPVYTSVTWLSTKWHVADPVIFNVVGMAAANKASQYISSIDKDISVCDG